MKQKINTHTSLANSTTITYVNKMQIAEQQKLLLTVTKVVTRWYKTLLKYVEKVQTQIDSQLTDFQIKVFKKVSLNRISKLPFSASYF